MVTVSVVAAPELRVVRRRKGAALVASAAPRALTAASAPIDDPAKMLKGGLGRQRDWQDEAWEMLRRVGELGYYVRWRSDSCSRVRLVASEIDPVTGEPTGSIADDNREGQRFAQIVREVAGGQLGQAQLIKRMTRILSVPGELWVAILVQTTRNRRTGRESRVEKWVPVTRKEIERSTNGRGVNIILPDGSKHEFNAANGDGMFRVWNPDTEKASEPDSPVRACLDALREIVATTKKIRNADLSRLINNGILFIPSEASLPSADDAPQAAGKPNGSGPGKRGSVRR